MSGFVTTKFPISKRNVSLGDSFLLNAALTQRSLVACLSCRSRRKKCTVDPGQKKCRNCKNKSIECKWDQISNIPAKESDLESEDAMENIYENMFYNNDQTKPQFVCSTQPLSLLLSRDSYLCFDGDFFGLYYPWRGLENEVHVESRQDTALRKFVDSQGAFVVPSAMERKRLILLFLTNLYPLFPVVSRKSLENTSLVPLILLNAIMLCATRFDTKVDQVPVRTRLKQFYERCRLLELVEHNKIVLIQSYLLLSIHEEGISGARDSKEYITKACNLCGELCIHNISGTNDISELSSSELNNSVRIKYWKGLLRRLFWVSFSLDRLVSATSGREMYYDRQDLIIDELSMEDFEAGHFQVSDLATCSKMVSLANLVERVQCSHYRPPTRRTVDTQLKGDILSWSLDENIANKLIRKLLEVYHAYIAILTFRCQIDTVGLILKSRDSGTLGLFDKEENLPLQEYSIKIMYLAASEPLVHHVLVVHAVLHVIALNQLEFNTASHGEKPENYYAEVSGMAKEVLTDLREYWWFAGAALRLCNVIWELNI